MKSSNISIGDLVVYKSAFLRSVQWYVSVPVDGKVTQLDGDIATVKWSNGYEVRVNIENLFRRDMRHLEPR